MRIAGISGKSYAGVEKPKLLQREFGSYVFLSNCFRSQFSVAPAGLSPLAPGNPRLKPWAGLFSVVPGGTKRRVDWVHTARFWRVSKRKSLPYGRGSDGGGLLGADGSESGDAAGGVEV